MGLAYDAIFIITRNDAIECTAQNVEASNEDCNSACGPVVGCGGDVVVVGGAGGAAGTQPSPGARSIRTATRTQPRVSITDGDCVGFSVVSVRLFIGAGTPVLPIVVSAVLTAPQSAPNTS